MKEKVTKNSGLKLISLFCAFFVWLSVVNIANPVKVDTIEVLVEVVNPEILERSNLTFEIVGKKTTVISYRIKTKDAYKIKASDFRAYADLSEMYDVTGAIPIKVEVLKNDELFQTTPTVKSPEVLKIKTEELQTKRFPLRANPYGTPADGYVQGEVTLNPDYAYVKGPVSLIGQINSVGIEFDIENAAADVSGTAGHIFYDANGNSLKDLENSVKVLGGDISYSMQILKVKHLPLNFVVTGEVPPGYKHTGIECSVKEAPVAGLKSALAAISSITIQSPNLNIEGATKDKVCEIDLAEYIDSNLQIAGMEDTKITVTLKVEPLQEKIYEIDTKDITLTGMSDQFDYTILNEKAEIRVQGLKEDLDSLSTDKMNISVDVSSLASPGTVQVAATLQLDDAYEIRQYPQCQIQAQAKPKPEESEAGGSLESKADSNMETKAEQGTEEKETTDKNPGKETEGSGE